MIGSNVLMTRKVDIQSRSSRFLVAGRREGFGKVVGEPDYN